MFVSSKQFAEGNSTMDAYKRHQWIWALIQHFLFPVIHAFRLDYEPISVDGPILLIANHVTACDPLLVAAALGKKQVYFVASDHILRQGMAGRFIQWGLGPIPRRKGSSTLVTVKECLRHLRSGHSVCIFGEGEQSWDGRSIPVVKGTGSLALAARVPLVTYRLEGGYLSLPRWGKGLRRGHVQGRVTGVYSPDALAAMGKNEINRLLNKSIGENAWKHQKEDGVRYRSRHAAEYLERCLYLCPGCNCIGTLKSRKDRLFCSCGFEARYTETGLFEPDSPFSNLAEWEDWQKEQLHRRRFSCTGEKGLLFSDADVSLTRIDEENHPALIAKKAAIRQFEDCLTCADRVFPLDEIRDMAMTQADRLLFSTGASYYEIRCGGRTNLRKYLEIWKEQMIH